MSILRIDGVPLGFVGGKDDKARGR
jgi:hypothetical protein